MKGWRQVTSQDGAELVTLQQGHADRQCHQDPTGLIKVSKRRWHAELRLETIKVSTYNLYSIHIYILPIMAMIQYVYIKYIIVQQSSCLD